MKISIAAMYAATICVSVGVLCGCGASSPPLDARSSMGPFARRSISPDSGASWVSPDAKRNDLLYVSDAGTNDVYIYSYPGGKMKGKLTGFARPAGLCVDGTGDVFVTDLDAEKIFVYRHGAKKAMRVLKDAGEDPGDCAVDPTTGNLAVTNVSTPYTGAGDVVIYKNARGKPKKYRDRDMFFYYFCGYDPDGNLYVDGAAKGNFEFAELPAGGEIFTPIMVDQNIQFGGAVQWDGQNVAVGDYESSVIFQFSISGDTATKVGKTPLDGSNFAIGFWIDGTRVIGANDDGGNVMYWDYPDGGDNVKKIGGLQNPWGITISRSK